jgi:hypothetical protein
MSQQINLFNPIFLQKKKHFSAVTMLQALGLLLGGIVAFYGYATYKSTALERVAAETRLQLQSQTEQVGRLTQEFSPQGASRMLEEEVARATARIKQREELLATLRTGGLGNTEGFARYLAAFARQSLPGVWLTGFAIGGDEAELRLSGKVLYSDLVPAYIRALNREEVMRGRRVAELQLMAREEREDAATAAPGAGQAVAKAPTAPKHYVEFNFSALRANGAATAPAVPAANGKGAK